MSYPQAVTVHTTVTPSTGPVYIQQQQHVILQGNERYKGNTGRILGIMQLCIGLVSLISGIIFTTWIDLFVLYAALWCGCVSM